MKRIFLMVKEHGKEIIINADYIVAVRIFSNKYVLILSGDSYICKKSENPDLDKWVKGVLKLYK